MRDASDVGQQSRLHLQAARARGPSADISERSHHAEVRHSGRESDPAGLDQYHLGRGRPWDRQCRAAGTFTPASCEFTPVGCEFTPTSSNSRPPRPRLAPGSTHDIPEVVETKEAAARNIWLRALHKAAPALVTGVPIVLEDDRYVIAY
eukprot:1188210-Prorocentrum_minimum.AAC.1